MTKMLLTSATAFANSVPLLNYQQAAGFIGALTGIDPNTAIIDVRALHDSDKAQPGHAIRGTLPQLWNAICAYQIGGFGVFVNVNELDGSGRGLSNVTAIRAHVVDLDNVVTSGVNYARAAAFNPLPSFAVITSPGKAHVYWPVQPYQGNDRYQMNQRKLCQLFDGDKSVVDASRVMRLPGTLHMKDPAAPHLVTCHALPGYGVPATVEALEAATAHVNVIDGAGGRHALGHPDLAAPSLEALSGALHLLDPNTLDRTNWISFSAAFKQSGWTLAPEQQLYNRWQQWCARYDDNDIGENHKQWNSIRNTEVGWPAIVRRLPQLALMSRQQRLADDKIIGDDLPTPPLPKIMTLDQMRADLVHVGDGSQIVHRACKTIRSKDDAPSEYAASVTEINTGKTDKAGNPVMKQYQTLELWRREPARTSVDVVTWQPGEAEICKAPDADQRAYNLWTPPRMLSVPANWHEWVKPFTDHVAYLVPVEPERMRFLQWLAHIFQRPGELPHTCYLMIATSTGIGRGTLASILTRALRGYVAANADVGMLLNKTFNGRLSQKLLATVDEIREGNSSQRYQQQENFKSSVVEEHRHINPKFGRQRIEKNCCRWLLFSNHLDALPFDNSDRRVIVIENPIAPAAPAWFEYLHSIMNHPAFIASVQHYLVTLDISTFKPGERAPMNAAKAKAVASMESAADRAARQFAATWPGDIATVADLREFLGDDAPIHAGAMRHVIERAGMGVGTKVKIAGKMQTILIVRGLLDRNDLANASKDTIADAVNKAQVAFRSQ